MREVSDRLCLEHSLSVIHNPQSRGMNYGEWRALKEGKPTVRGGIREDIDAIIEKLTGLGCKNVILTGVSYAAGKTGIVVFENGEYAYYEHELLPNSCHGTGDIYASAFVGALVRGKSAYDAAAIAANYTMECIRYTAKVENHWYGAAFEPVLGKLIEALN